MGQTSSKFKCGRIELVFVLQGKMSTKNTMEKKMEKKEKKHVERELGQLMAKTLALEDELNALVMQARN